MNKAYIFFLFISLILSSFAIVNQNQPLSKINVTPDRKLPVHIPDSAEIVFFESDDFVNSALENYTIPNITRFFSGVLYSSKESVVNDHDPDEIDTIYTFSNPENLIRIYRAKHNDFIFMFDISDSVFMLSDGIRPGMTKDMFLKKLHLGPSKQNKVQILNTEDNIQFTFSFKNDKLMRIQCNLYLD